MDGDNATLSMSLNKPTASHHFVYTVQNGMLMVINSHSKGRQGSRWALTWAPGWHSWRAGCQLCWFSGTSRAASPRWNGRTPPPSPLSSAPAPQAVWACRSTALHTCVVQQTDPISIMSSHKGFSHHYSLRFQNRKVISELPSARLIIQRLGINDDCWSWGWFCYCIQRYLVAKN